MKPFNEKYVLEQIDEYNEKIKTSKSGKYEIKEIDGLQGIISGYMYEKKGIINKKILELHGPEHIWMRLTPYEIEASYFPIKMAKGKVGVVGLGLGYAVQEMAKKDSVEEVIVYEISKDVIDIYNSNFEKNNKITIINEDAYKAKSEKFDFFYVDIYEYKLTSKVVKDYKVFTKLHNIEEYSFFGMEHFLLSCSYTDVMWVYVPENWVEASQRAFQSLEQNQILDYYYKLDENIVSQVLSEFKVILNEI